MNQLQFTTSAKRQIVSGITLSLYIIAVTYPNLLHPAIGGPLIGGASPPIPSPRYQLHVWKFSHKQQLQRLFPFRYCSFRVTEILINWFQYIAARVGPPTDMLEWTDGFGWIRVTPTACGPPLRPGRPDSPKPIFTFLYFLYSSSFTKPANLIAYLLIYLLTSA